MRKSARTSSVFAFAVIALAARPARCFSALLKEPGPGAFRTSNTASASASRTSATRALSSGSSGSSPHARAHSPGSSRSAFSAMSSAPFPFLGRSRSTPALSSQRYTVFLSAPIRSAISATDDPCANIIAASSRAESGRDLASSSSRRPSFEAHSRTGRAPATPRRLATCLGSMPPASSLRASRFVSRG